MRGERDLDLFPVLYINSDGDRDKQNPTNRLPSFATSRAAYSGGFLSSSSTNVGSGKRKVRPLLATMNECPHSGDWYNIRDEHTFPLHRLKLCHEHDTTTCLRQVTSAEDEHTKGFFQIKETGGDKHTSAFLTTKCIPPGDAFLPPNYTNIQLNNQAVSRSANIYSSYSFPQHLTHLERESKATIHHDRESKVKIAVKKEDFSNTCTLGQNLNLSTDEIVKVIGPKLFLEARKTMIHQQKIFSWQTFELHRLITVQRLIGRSPETVHPIKFPPMTKLLYVSPLDTSPKTKIDAPKSEKGPNPGPWCFPPPPGNQWLIPVRSPSEGLVYKPYPGPCFPSIGIMSGTSYSVPAVTDGEIGQSYFPGYPVPLINEVDKLFSELHKHKESERHALALFPTTPDVLKEQRNDQKVQVIKVVPYSRDSTPASTARILQSLQEGRTTNQD